MYFVYLLTFVYRSSALSITVYGNVYPTERSGKQLKNSLYSYATYCFSAACG